MSKFAEPRKFWTIIGLMVIFFFGPIALYEATGSVEITGGIVFVGILIVVGFVILGDPKVWGIRKEEEPEPEQEKKRSLFWWQDQERNEK